MMKSSRLLIALTVFLTMISISQAKMDTSVCTKGGKPPVRDKPFPTVPDVFSAHIDMNVVGNKTTRYIHELFDAPNDRAMVYETIATGPFKNITMSGREIYNFYSNQIVELVNIPGAPTACGVSMLDGKGKDTFIFGNSAKSTSGFSAKSAFMVSNDFPPSYQGRKTLENGIVADMWWDCVYIDALDATVTAEWYFTAEMPDWTSALGDSVPVMLKVNGKANLGGAPNRVVNNIYTFNSFYDMISHHGKQFFNIPQGAVCPHLNNMRNDADDKSSHSIPDVAPNGHFSFDAELVQKLDSDNVYVTSIRELHDETIQMSRYDLNPGGLVDNILSDAANLPLTEIHDFMTGLVYVIDRLRFNCTVAPLAEAKRFDVVSVDSSHVRMKTVKEFFGLTNSKNTRMNWTYTGQRTERGIKADIYAAERLGYPAGSDPNARSIWEIAFMSDDDLMVNRNEQDFEVQEPIRLWMRMPDGKEMTYNVFNFDERQPDLYHYDFGFCYMADQKEEVTFKLPGSHWSLIQANKKQFYYFLLLGISGALDLTSTRISGINFHLADDGEAILVRFTLLDPPSMKGSVNDKLPKNYMISREEVLKLMKTAIDNEEFLIKGGSLNTNEKLVQMTALKGSLNQKDTGNSTTIIQLDSGAAAGIGIALFIVGLAVGVLIIFLVNKFRGQSLAKFNLSFDPKTFKNES